MISEKQIEEILKDPQKLRALAKDMRTEADRLEAKAANTDMPGTRGACAAVSCVALSSL